MVIDFTEEKLGKAEKTELDASFENLLQRADQTEQYTKQILSALENYLQPNPSRQLYLSDLFFSPALRVEEYFYDKLEMKKEQRLNNLETLGVAMIQAGNEFGPGTAYGSILLKIGNTQQKLGLAEKEFIGAAATNVLTPLKRFLEGDIKTIAVILLVRFSFRIVKRRC
ncbi:unnamed protein product [Soboliphyme baturini]|uniref:BAR domain-containing protein n=1 Tax=Soboliphyme baturini TaxID=241478 RepID=A0A183ICL9_9BILA|nr:unnamed protein product [Soboliphyme baturini]